MPKFGMKVPHLRCDSHTSFKVKRSEVRVTGGWRHTVSAEPAGHMLVLYYNLSVCMLGLRLCYLNLFVCLSVRLTLAVLLSQN